MKDDDWASLLPPLQSALKGHEPYLRRAAYERAKGLKRKIRPHKVKLRCGVTLKVLPSVSKTSDFVKENCVGGINEGDEDEVEGMTDEEFEKLLNEGKIYVGKVTYSNVKLKKKKKNKNKKETLHKVPTRVFNLKKQLMVQAHELLQRDMLCLKNQAIKMKLADWWDSCPLYGKSAFAYLVNFVFEEEVASESAEFHEFTRPLPWKVGFMQEDKESMADVRKEFGECAKDLSFTLHHKGIPYNFSVEPAIDKADHQAAQKGLGNKVGGNHRCERCSAKFGKADIRNLFSFTAMWATVDKSLQTLRTLSKTQLTAIGMDSLPHVLNGKTKESLESLNLAGLQQGPDNLHNLKGTTKLVLDSMRAIPGWDEDLFLDNLYKYLKRTSNFFFFNCC
jgi:hypothetical protein